MNKIEVKVLNEASSNPEGMMMFLARLTQRGHSVHNMGELLAMYNECMNKTDWKSSAAVSNLPHGTITRFTPITVAIVGASRRYLAQARTHQVGVNYVSASLQYSDYSGKADFVVPYSILEHDAEAIISGQVLGDFSYTGLYLTQCKSAMETYKTIASCTDNDTAGYVAPQGLRNILIIQANNEAWKHIIRLRCCNRNTVETQYVTALIWKELLNTAGGKELFKYAGPDCVFGQCREGKMCCGTKIKQCDNPNSSIPEQLIAEKWPLLVKEGKR